MTSPDALADAIYSGQSAISNLKSTMSTKLLIGFCLALRRSLLNAFGLLEEACFLGADDLELSWRLRTLGFQLAIAQNVFVAHDCGGSFNTISSEEKRNHVSASDASLLRKLQNFYGHGQLPSSRDLWGNDIFTGAMEAFKS